jgi:hypothetical protein
MKNQTMSMTRTGKTYRGSSSRGIWKNVYNKPFIQNEEKWWNTLEKRSN